MKRGNYWHVENRFYLVCDVPESQRYEIYIDTTMTTAEWVSHISGKNWEHPALTAELGIMLSAQRRVMAHQCRCRKAWDVERIPVSA